MEIGVDIIQVVSEANLVSIPGKETEKLFLVHATEDGSRTNLETIQMQDWQHCP